MVVADASRFISSHFTFPRVGALFYGIKKSLIITLEIGSVRVEGEYRQYLDEAFLFSQDGSVHGENKIEG